MTLVVYGFGLFLNRRDYILDTRFISQQYTFFAVFIYQKSLCLVTLIKSKTRPSSIIVLFILVLVIRLLPYLCLFFVQKMYL